MKFKHFCVSFFLSLFGKGSAEHTAVTIQHTHHLALIPPLLLITYIHMIHAHPSVILSEDHQLLQLPLMFFFTVDQVRKELRKIKARKAPGPDGITSRLLCRSAQ